MQLDAERSNYVCKALRKIEGDAIDVFNGLGSLFRCRLIKAHTRRAQIKVIEHILTQPQPEQAPCVAIAMLKGQAMDRAIQQATELGAKDIWLINAERSNVALKSDRLSQKMAHWRRIVDSACEQCGQLWLPTLKAPVTADECLNQQIKIDGFVVFDPDGEPMPSALTMQNPLIFIGPEGGWSEVERAVFATAGAAVFCFGNTILRAETMPAVGIALVQQARGWPS